MKKVCRGEKVGEEKESKRTRSDSANSERRRSSDGGRASALTHSINLKDGDVEATKEGKGILGNGGGTRDKKDTTVQTKTLSDGLEHQFIGQAVEHRSRGLGAASLGRELVSHPVLLTLKKKKKKKKKV